MERAIGIYRCVKYRPKAGEPYILTLYFRIVPGLLASKKIITYLEPWLASLLGDDTFSFVALIKNDKGIWAKYTTESGIGFRVLVNGGNADRRNGVIFYSQNESALDDIISNITKEFGIEAEEADDIDDGGVSLDEQAVEVVETNNITLLFPISR